MESFKKDFTNYKFRPSGVGKLMVESRSKKDALSETTKTYLKELYIKEVFGRERDTSNKYTEKGLYSEEDSFTLLQSIHGTLFLKNQLTFENEFVKGTPDIVFSKYVIDVDTRSETLPEHFSTLKNI